MVPESADVLFAAHRDVCVKEKRKRANTIPLILLTHLSILIQTQTDFVWICSAIKNIYSTLQSPFVFGFAPEK